MKCTLIFLLISFCGIFTTSEVSALRCVSPDGLQVEDVRKVIKKCMKKITVDYDASNNDDSVDDGENEAKNYDEYENFDDDYETRNKNVETNGEREDKNTRNSRRNNDRMNNYSKNNNPMRLNHNYDYPQTGGNYYEMNRRNDRHDPAPQYNPYQFTYNDNNHFNNQRSSSYGSNGNSQNKNNDNSTADKQERDRSCILQCFFQELKMTNDEGFPERNHMTNVLTKQLRDRELKSFYIDSIQECFRMINLDPKLLRDNCLHSKNLITCLAERAKMNCADWNAETVIF